MTKDDTIHAINVTERERRMIIFALKAGAGRSELESLKHEEGSERDKFWCSRADDYEALAEKFEEAGK